MEINRILVPVDLSETSFGALGTAIPLAEITGARLTLMTVDLPLVDDPLAPPAFPDPEVTIGRFRALLAKWKKCHPHFPLTEDQIHFIVRTGSVVDEILKAVEREKADLVVMATHCRRGLSRMVIGSVTELVIRRAECPVLAVPPKAWDVVEPAQTPPRHAGKRGGSK